MYTIFIEYKIHATSKKQYFQDRPLITKRLKKEGLPHTQALEATDQFNLFVEVLQMDQLGTYNKWKEMHKEGDINFPWEPMMKHIVGGRAKFNMWAFQPVPLSAYARQPRDSQA